jgi:hypothetical protein
MSASDENCEGTYGWCDLDLPFPKWIVWEEGQPDNGAGGPIEHCITLDYDLGYIFQVYLTDRGCNSVAKFICEVRKYNKIGQ